MKQFERCDPERHEELKSQIKICKEACDRWVDNIFITTSYIKKGNPSMTQENL